MTQARLKSPEPRELPSLSGVVLALFVVVATGALTWGSLELSDPAALPIRKVLVEGEFSHLNPEHVQTAVVAAVDAGFFGLKVGEIRELLLNEPWVRDATIRRVWPDALHVSIVEQKPVARWGNYGLLNAQADLFVPAPEDLPDQLVELDGPLGTEFIVLQRYEYLRAQLGAIGLTPTAVRLSERHAWTVTTTGGREIVFGRRDFDLRLARFIFGYSRALAEAWPQIGRVDLRYTNGFAVGERAADDRSG